MAGAAWWRSSLVMLQIISTVELRREFDAALTT
jgi:hypothetical protein